MKENKKLKLGILFYAFYVWLIFCGEEGVNSMFEVDDGVLRS